MTAVSSRRSQCRSVRGQAASGHLPALAIEHGAELCLLGDVTGENVLMAFKPAASAAKIEDFRFHDLRHTAASWLPMKGADIHTVAQLLGHKDLRMAARYQHLSPTFLSEAIKKLDGVFSEVPAIAAA